MPCGSVPDPGKGPYKVRGYLLITEKETGRRYEYPIQMADREKYISVRPDFTGIPGYSYTLDIDIRYNYISSHYRAETRMLATPPIDSISYYLYTKPGKYAQVVPQIYFLEPKDEKNYYLFQLCSSYRDGYSQPYHCSGWGWNYSVLSDEFLPEQVKGLTIDDGASHIKYMEHYPPFDYNLAVRVQMYTIDYTTFVFYKGLTEQFNNDGGAFSPTPATPRGNIKGAVGLFRALHHSSREIFTPEWPDPDQGE